MFLFYIMLTHTVFVVLYLYTMYSLVAQIVKNLPAMQEIWVQSLGWGRSPGEENGNLLQFSSLENSMDRGAWWAIVHGVTKEWDMTE